MAKERKRVIIMGAAGRDFHNFNVYFRDNPEYEVVAFTATQIPGIEKRMYPPELAGKLYPNGIPIYPEEKLPELIREYNVDFVVFSYSDVSHQHVMDRAAIAVANGASYLLLGPEHTMIKSKKPVIAVGAIRTGCGKSTVSRKIVQILRDRGIKVIVIRHPMPYGDLRKQIVQRFETFDDLDKHNVTFEEREEYEHYIEMGFVVYAGVDYEKILREAEKEADVILWDGGNNDYPFYKPDLFVVVADALRPGHELTYWPGSANTRMADVIVINKVVEAGFDAIKQVEENIKRANPRAIILYGASVVEVDNPELIDGKRVLVVEDGPTVLHGEMPYGAGYIAAIKYGAREIVDPRKWVKSGTDLAKAYEVYKHMGPVLPTLGYSEEEKKEVENVINASDADTVVSGTPIDLSRVLKVNKPIVRVRYRLEELGEPKLERIIDKFLKDHGLR
mgnify:CR=1 FL=1